MRIGQGYDVHRLVEGRELMLGGINIPYGKDLFGYSNADVFLYVISDALLGTTALGDIDTHFPGSDPTYSGTDSAELLRAVGNLIRAAGYEIGNINSMVVCRASKLAPHIGVMRARIAGMFAFPVGAVSVKASNEEHIGFTGRGEGIATHAVCLLTERTR